MFKFFNILLCICLSFGTIANANDDQPSAKAKINVGIIMCYDKDDQWLLTSDQLKKAMSCKVIYNSSVYVGYTDVPIIERTTIRKNPLVRNIALHWQNYIGKEIHQCEEQCPKKGVFFVGNRRFVYLLP